MTDMVRARLSPEAMAYQATHEALGDAGIAPHQLGLVILANATAGRLNNQGCVRGQTWLRKAGLTTWPSSTSTTLAPEEALRCIWPR